MSPSSFLPFKSPSFVTAGRTKTIATFYLRSIVQEPGRMHFPHLLLSLLSLLSWTTQTLAQEQADPENLTTQTLMMLDAAGSTLIATVTLLNSGGAASLSPNTSPQPTTFAPSAPATQIRAQQSPAPETTSEAPAPSIHTSVIQATRTESVYVPAASGSTTTDENGVDVEGGASGSSSSGFSLSRGGMIAVIVVVVCVAVFGGKCPHPFTTPCDYRVVLTCHAEQSSASPSSS